MDKNRKPTETKIKLKPIDFQPFRLVSVEIFTNQ